MRLDIKYVSSYSNNNKMVLYQYSFEFVKQTTVWN